MNMSNEKKEIAVSYDVEGQEIKLTKSIVEQYIVGTGTKITLPEFKFFTELCKARKLNPFLKEAYCIKYGSQPAQIVVGKDVFIKRAAKNPNYDGKETGIIVIDENGELVERKGCFSLPSEKVVGGWAKVYIKNHEHPEYMSVSLSEVAGKKRDGSLNSNWANKPATMIEKVAKVRALREAFPEEFNGMYTAEELEIEDAPIVEVSPEDVSESEEPIEEVKSEEFDNDIPEILTMDDLK